MIFIILEEDNTIRKRFQPQKSNIVSGKSKAIYYKNLTQKVLAMELGFYPIIIQNNRKAAMHFRKSRKNQLSHFEKEFKEACINLEIIDRKLPNKDAIWS